MKTKLVFVLAMLVIGVSIFRAQSHPETKPANAGASCSMDRSDYQEEVRDLGVYTARMQSRIVMIRNSAGIVENPQVRNALQVDADMWQDELDHKKQRMTRLQTLLDRCEAREKINSSK